MVDVLNLVVTQALLVNPAGGRIALREWLFFDDALKARLLEADQTVWPGMIRAALEGTGNSLWASGEAAHAAGRIGDADRRRLMAGAADAEA